jgi:hypothetical protein
MDLLLAGAIAALLAFIELQSRLTSLQPRALNVWGFWTARIGMEVLVAAGAAIVARGAVPSDAAAAFPPWLVVGIAGGLGGPAFVRLTLLTFGKDASATPIGLASFYEPVRNYFERQLDEIGADAQTAWMRQTVIPGLKAQGITPDMLADQLRTYVKSLSRLSSTEQLDIITWIKGTAADTGLTNEQKMETLLFKGLNLGARRNIERLLRMPPTPAPPTTAPQPPQL